MDVNNGRSNLSKKEIMEAGQPVVFGLANRRSRVHLLKTVALLPLVDRGRIYEVSETKRKANEGIDGNCKQKRPKKKTPSQGSRLQWNHRLQISPPNFSRFNQTHWSKSA
jgi:hypothetical protein